MVEWRELQKEMKVLRGKRLTRNLLDDNASYPVFHGGIEPLGRYGDYNREANTVMVINVGASAGTVGFCDSRFWSSDGCFCISHSDIINSKFLYYFMLGKTHFLQSQVRYAGIPTLDNSVIEKIRIPILSLSEQNHIVEILDTFTSSIENLKQQIAERRMQFEYYRDQLLDFEEKEEFEVKTMEQICNITAGGDVPKNNLSSEKTNEYNIPIVSNGVGEKAIYGYTNIIKINRPSVTISARGTIGYAEYRDYPFYPIIRLITVTPKDSETKVKYLYYLLSKQKYNVSKSGIPQLTVPTIKVLQIPLFSLEEQSRIVSILDTFEASIANLEAQLKQREKQYEYYRNKLLTFE